VTSIDRVATHQAFSRPERASSCRSRPPPLDSALAHVVRPPGSMEHVAMAARAAPPVDLRDLRSTRSLCAPERGGSVRRASACRGIPHPRGPRRAPTSCPAMTSPTLITLADLTGGLPLPLRPWSDGRAVGDRDGARQGGPTSAFASSRSPITPRRPVVRGAASKASGPCAAQAKEIAALDAPVRIVHGTEGRHPSRTGTLDVPADVIPRARRRDARACISGIQARRRPHDRSVS